VDWVGIFTNFSLLVADIQAKKYVNPLNAELNPICHLLALLRAHHILHVCGLRVLFRARSQRNLERVGSTYDRLCGLVVRVSGYRYRGTGFDSRRYQIFWIVVGLERGPLSLVCKPETATAVVELLMMDMRMPETC
jgi:hypothetical protein